MERLKQAKLRTQALEETTRKRKAKHIETEEQNTSKCDQKTNLKASTHLEHIQEKAKLKSERQQTVKEMLDFKKKMMEERNNEESQQKALREAQKRAKSNALDEERKKKQIERDTQAEKRRLQKQQDRDKKEALKLRAAQLRADVQEKKMKLALEKIETQNQQLRLQKTEDLNEDEIEDMLNAITADRKVLADEKAEYKAVGGMHYEMLDLHV